MASRVRLPSEVSVPRCGRFSGGGGRTVELLSPVSVSTAVLSAPALSWRLWGVFRGGFPDVGSGWRALSAASVLRLCFRPCVAGPFGGLKLVTSRPSEETRFGRL